ncbi:ribbon-helix-helix protein, CopG family [Candidatus Daviesbacteria bacterium]|nr:ribbon-helix-helix protein, CopG family [Candidatus Daviesbacteria bacterium]
MQRISVYIPEEIKQRINLAAKAKNKVESEIIRDALKEGLEVVHPISSSAQALLDFVKLMEKIPTKGKVPKDAVENMDYYLWGGEKRK